MEIKNNYNININNSYRSTIIRFIMFFVLTVVIGFEIFAYNSIQNYYKQNLIGSMLNQAKINQLIFDNYTNKYDLSDIIIGDKNAFYRGNVSQVQILDNSGIVLFDSQASDEVGSQLMKADVLSSKEGKQGIYKSYNEKTKEEVLSISYPLMVNDQQAGILRLTSSLNKVKKKVKADMFFIFYLEFLS
ncbi:hypothetical protein [Anaerococcus provencensis]|uniref:hypothetical protein n=1 Tax=Anaerococcus provencensis TaxID=938293 RepID=UPI002DD63D69|nr:hypothetical protein [Anaerococcus provencensis]